MSRLIAFLLICLLTFIYNFQEIYEFAPFSVHKWRQSDAYSMALNYYNKGSSFFDPSIHFHSSKGGKAVGEFPIIYYLNSFIWKFTGVNFWVPRIVNTLIVLGGFYSLFLISFRCTKKWLLSFITSIISFSSPLIVFYTNNFLVNVPALSIVFISWYFFMKYFKDNDFKSLLFGVLLISLAGLLRGTIMMGYIPILVIFTLEKLNILKRNWFKISWIRGCLILMIPLLINILWVVFAKYYNSINESRYFLLKIRPIWSLNLNEIELVFNSFLDFVVPSLFHSILGYLVLFAMLFLPFMMKRIPRYLTVILLSLLFVELAYTFMWYANMNVHDYYYIDWFLFIPILPFTVYKFFKKLRLKNGVRFAFYGLILISIACSITYTSTINILRYKPRETVFTDLLIENSLLKNIKSSVYHHKKELAIYEGMGEFLDSIGIKRNMMVASFPDPSPNITLSLIDRPGITYLYLDNKSNEFLYKHIEEKGISYLLVNDDQLIEKRQFNERYNLISVYNGVRIFKIAGK